jgi:hypothetical protein
MRAVGAIAAREGTAQGIITARQTARFDEYYVYVFSVNGQWFTGRDSSPRNGLEIAAQVLVYYDSQNPKTNALTDFAELSRNPFTSISNWWNAQEPPPAYLILGFFSLILAVVGTCTGTTLAPHHGVFHRADDPKEFRWLVATYCLGGVFFIGYYLYLVT